MKKKEKKMNQEVANKESGQMASPSDLAAWGTQELTSQDIIIPRLLIMQGMSAIVTADKAKIGDIVENLGEKIIGGIDSGVEILPFKLTKVWKYVDAEGKTLLIEPITHENENKAYEEVEIEGVTCKPFRTFQFYVLLPSEVEAGGALPYMVEFKSTGLRAGKKLVTQMFTKNGAIGKSPAGKTFMLNIEKVTKGRNTFAVPDVEVMRDSSGSEEAVALKWFKALEGGARVHENEDA